MVFKCLRHGIEETRSEEVRKILKAKDTRIQNNKIELIAKKAQRSLHFFLAPDSTP